MYLMNKIINNSKKKILNMEESKQLDEIINKNKNKIINNKKFDDFIKNKVNNNKELEEFIRNEIKKQLPYRKYFYTYKV